MRVEVEVGPCDGCECSLLTHVFLGLLSMVPSSRTIPTPTLFADPSMPRASILVERTERDGGGSRRPVGWKWNGG